MTIELRESIASVLVLNGIEVDIDNIIDVRSKAIRLLGDNGIDIDEYATLYDIYDACQSLAKTPTLTH
ncbi:MAG: hypothetical protein KKA19_06330 [Candidatus Margulisbacteria bacterium]|nr:hypothetical protein [Candidatus Margulisiibacteriota bacterium]